MKIPVNLNEEQTVLDAIPSEPLLNVLRRMGIFSVKCGCQDGFCGNCMVLLNGKPVPSCQIPCGIVRDNKVITLEFFTNPKKKEAVLNEDPKAKKLNEKFCEFLHANCNWFIPNDDPQNDNWDIYIDKDVTFLDFITDEGTSANLIALISGTFNGAYFSRTPLNNTTDVERLSNDRKGKYYKHYQAIVFPAYIPDDEIFHFNIHNKKIYNVKKGGKEAARCGGNTCGIHMQNGIYTSSNFFAGGNKHYINLKMNEYYDGLENSLEINSGEQYFISKEVEVFQVLFI
jgi:carbon-monoxide dehydrogenase small subunit